MNDKLEQVKEAVTLREERTRHKQQLDRMTALEKTVVSTARQIVQYLDGKTTKTEVINQLKSVSTPDIDKVVIALEKLDNNITSNQLDISPLTKGLDALEQQLKKLPTSFPEQKESPEAVTVKNQIDIKPLEKAIKNLKLEPTKVDVAAPNVQVDAPDLKPLQESLLAVVKAVNNKEIPKTDLSEVEKKLDQSNKHLKALVEKPIARGGGGGGGGLPFESSTGTASHVTLNADGSLPTSSKPVAIRLDDTTTENITYIGKAAIGSLTSAAVWQIQKMDETTGLVITWRDGDSNFDNIWDTRAAGSYS